MNDLLAPSAACSVRYSCSVWYSCQCPILVLALFCVQSKLFLQALWHFGLAWNCHNSQSQLWLRFFIDNAWKTCMYTGTEVYKHNWWTNTQILHNVEIQHSLNYTWSTYHWDKSQFDIIILTFGVSVNTAVRMRWAGQGRAYAPSVKGRKYGLKPVCESHPSDLQPEGSSLEERMNERRWCGRKCVKKPSCKRRMTDSRF